MVENLQSLCGDVEEGFAWQLRRELQMEPRIMLLAATLMPLIIALRQRMGVEVRAPTEMLEARKLKPGNSLDNIPYMEYIDG